MANLSIFARKPLVRTKPAYLIGAVILIVAAVFAVYAINSRPRQRIFVRAASANESSIYVGDNDHLNVQFGDKKSADATAVVTATNAPDVSMSLLGSDAKVAKATVRLASANTVEYEINSNLSLRYDFGEWQLKESVIVKSPLAIADGTLSFSLNAPGLSFKQDTDGSWQAFKAGESTPSYRIFKPTVFDAKHNPGPITLDIANGRATYSIDRTWLASAAYPLDIDPTITSSGITCTWTNGAGTNVWATAGNWDCGHAPAAGDSVVFDGAINNTAANAAAGTVTDNLYSVTTNANYTATVTFAAAPINSSGDHHVWNLQTMTVNGGTLVFTGDTTVNPVTGYGCSSSIKCGQGINIVTGGDVTVGSGAKISADGTGFAGGSGPGAGVANNSAGGAGYGGNGGSGSSGALGGTAYGSTIAPVNVGSGGGLNCGGGSGGGAVQLNVSGVLTNNGTISANGNNGPAGGCNPGGGSGGSVYLTASTLGGTGSLSANGGNGNGNGGGGGGGRIAAIATVSTYSGPMTDYGGTVANVGANGTTYTKIGSSVNGNLTLDNNGIDSRSALTSLPVGSYVFDSISLKNKGDLAVGNGVTLDIRSATCTISGDGTGILHHLGTGVLVTDPSFTIGTWKLAEDTPAIGSVTNLTVSSGGSLTHTQNTTAEIYKLNIILTTLTVNNGGFVSADGTGFAGGSGPGAGGAGNSGGGAGYGGNGGSGHYGESAGTAYGSTIAPINIGSGGGANAVPGGSGGGAVQLTVSGVFTNNGTISANGNNGTGINAGGGSGGSIYLTAGTLCGTGSLSANGGNSGPSGLGGGGGGGRIAVIATASTYSGSMTDYGGTVANVGGAGTIYKNINGVKTITIDNNGISANAGTGITESSLAGYGTLTITNGGMLTHRANITAETYKLNLTVDNLNVTSTGSINVNGKGYAPNGNGPGGGGGSGGAGYGGSGGNSNGGGTYGSVTAPVNVGSSGGNFGGNSGGAGGGAVQLTVTGTLTNGGTISANGSPASNYGGGGGSGGSVYLTVGTIAGGGSIAANGGLGNSGGGYYPAGGGGGGRVSIVFVTNTYSGTEAAYGGIESMNAANGTIYAKSATQSKGSLLLDNNGVDSGRILTLLPAGSYAFDSIILNHKGNLAVGNGATLDIRAVITTINGDGTGILTHLGTGVLTTDSSLTIAGWQLAEDTTAIGSVTSLTITNGGVLTHTANNTAETYKLNLTVDNLNVTSTGSINANGKGYAPAGNGPGGGGGSGGAGYGGSGGNSGGASGGTYGSVTAPVNVGSSGGNFGGNSGGAGGGAVQLNVSGTLTNSGTISANGSPASSYGSGGGSGGSVFLTVGTLAGSGGSITANGGNSSGTYGAGGGGGGRIAIYIKTTDSYTGTKTVTTGNGGSPAAQNGTLVYQHFPQLSFSTPADGATGISALPTLSLSATDADSDYYRLKLEVSTDNFLTSCAFTQTATVSSFAKGSCSGGYNNLSGSFAGMDTDTNADSTLDSYSAGHAGSFIFSSALSPSATYNFRASACDPLGACGDISTYSLSSTHSVSTTAGVPAINLKGGSIQFKSGTSVLK